MHIVLIDVRSRFRCHHELQGQGEPNAKLFSRVDDMGYAIRDRFPFRNLGDCRMFSYVYMWPVSLDYFVERCRSWVRVR